LNEEFRRWLAEYARHEQRARAALALVEELRGYVCTGGGRSFTRDQMNER
jgi:hypothetical protein